MLLRENIRILLYLWPPDQEQEGVDLAAVPDFSCWKRDFGRDHGGGDQEIEGIIRELVSGGAWDQLDDAVQILTTSMAVTASPK